ncbi:DUF1016 N-terminal domain-containing protein [Bradyrhizobium sp. Pa8]|uniref:DUF1016 N-terminal domain-containing protein n=1 Tax=Bradyrhizobium sp. Pa8 TaxID=3386552 RepID=UPI00403F8CB9
MNREPIPLYWTIRRDIPIRLEKNVREPKSSITSPKTLAAPSRDDRPVRSKSPVHAGVAEAWPHGEFVHRLLHYWHNARLRDAIKRPDERAWYARQAIEHGWSRNVLLHQIDSDLFARQGSALTNFSRPLPPEQSELAHWAHISRRGQPARDAADAVRR